MCVTFFVGAVARYPNEIGRAKVRCFDLGAHPFSRFFQRRKVRNFWYHATYDTISEVSKQNSLSTNHTYKQYSTKYHEKVQVHQIDALTWKNPAFQETCGILEFIIIVSQFLSLVPSHSLNQSQQTAKITPKSQRWRPNFKINKFALYNLCICCFLISSFFGR